MFVSFSVRDRTYSFWNHVLQHVHDYTNRLFRPQSIYASHVLLPVIDPSTLKYEAQNVPVLGYRPRSSRFWLGMYHRFDGALLPKENVSAALTDVMNRTTALNAHARRLEKVGAFVR